MPSKSLRQLIENINPKAKLPRGFGLWSTKMQEMWLRQNQRKATASATGARNIDTIVQREQDRADGVLPPKKGRTRVRLSWHTRKGIVRSIEVRRGIHLTNLVETLSKAPGIIGVFIQVPKKGERIK